MACIVSHSWHLALMVALVLSAPGLASETVQRHVAGREPRKVIVVAGRLVNVVV